MYFDNDFMNYMGWRDSEIQNKANEIERRIRNGETTVTVDRGDLTDSELAEVKRRVDRTFGR